MTDLKQAIGKEYEWDYLRAVASRCLPSWTLLLGEFRVSRAEATIDSARLAEVMTARIWATLEAAGEQLRAPTLPVHDEPMPHELQREDR